ncbi:MAG: hypothetical protein Q8R31_07065 [Candidatus Omnitrophota bacterium]|nr:hypothetical protein [Candidatus Omnitrophota bacterium]
MDKYSGEEIKKIEKYLHSKKEILNFVLSRQILTTIVFYLSVISLILWLGGKSYIEYIIKTRIDKAISEKIDEEYTYLSERNKITELGDLAISTGKIKYYDNLGEFLDSKKQERINNAAKAELMRIENLFFASGDEYFPEEKLKYTSPDGKILQGYAIPTEGLIELFHKADRFGEKTTILMMLDHRYEKNIPDFLLKVAFNTDNLRMRYVALRTLQILIDDFSVNQFDYEENEKLWYKCKEDFYKRVEK